MTSSSYLQRIVARMGTPAAGVGPVFTPPDAPAPAIFDPFADAEPLDAEIAPPLSELRAAALPPPPSPTIVERSELLPPGEVVERVIHEAQASVPGVSILPPADQLPASDLPLPQPAPISAPEQIASPPSEVTAWETLTEIVQQFVALAQDQERPPLELPSDPAPQPALEPEDEERIRYEFVEPPRQTSPISPVEPPLDAEAPAAAPVFESPAPQITIGDIVVEIVTRSETPGRTNVAVPPRAAPPSEPPAPPRAGVRSKRGYGIGQM
ncbi:MAG TPA: hypothetical protein VGD69_19125 [Herpetosiphonaceae bacterium]